jgi:hypothetical protein
VLKCGTATFATWRQRTFYDNNCFIILYFVSGKVEQNEEEEEEEEEGQPHIHISFWEFSS